MERGARDRYACRAMVGMCCFLALIRIADVATPFFNPVAWTMWRVSCVYSVCEWRPETIQLLPPSVQAAAIDRPEVIAAVHARAAVPKNRALLILAEFVHLVPETLFLLSVALGFRQLGKGKAFGQQTLGWLRRAAGAALLSALALPLAAAIQMAVLLPNLPGGFLENEVSVYVPAGEMLAGLFFASAAWVVARALDEGRRTQSELAEYV